MFKPSLGTLFRLMVTLAILLLVVSNEYANHRSQTLYAGYFDGIFYLIFLSIFTVFVIFDIVFLVKTKNLFVILPSVTGILLITISIFIHFYHEKKLYESTLYTAISKEFMKNDIDVKYRIQFKESGNYVLFEDIDSGLLTNYYYGTYTKKDSLIVMDRKIENLNLSNRFLIMKVDSIKKFDFQLVQIDDFGHKLNNKITFRFD